MYKVEISDYSMSQLRHFINYRKHYFKEKFYDTGIFNEDEIVRNYLSSIDTFFDDLKVFLVSSLNSGFLWEIKIKTDSYETRKVVLFFWNYVLTLEIKKWLVEKIITIEDILIRS